MARRNVELLLVEDNPSDLELTLHVLRADHPASSIEVARDGEQALDFMFCRGPFRDRDFVTPRVVLLDLKLPKVNGLEVLKAIREDARTSCTPVVVLTSSKEQPDVVRSYRLGVNSYIEKPVAFDQFQKTIRELGLYWLVANQPPPIL